MGYIMVAVVCFVAGYVLGVFSARRAKQELYETLSALNSKVDELQKSFNEKVDELQSRVSGSLK